jgi:hypothetical protein
MQSIFKGQESRVKSLELLQLVTRDSLLITLQSEIGDA